VAHDFLFGRSLSFVDVPSRPMYLYDSLAGPWNFKICMRGSALDPKEGAFQYEIQLASNPSL